MKLTIHERFTLLELLPPENTFAGIKEIYKAKLHLNLTEDEEIEIIVHRSSTNQPCTLIPNSLWDIPELNMHDRMIHVYMFF